jgi:ABC-type transport system substrate-binding protein
MGDEAFGRQPVGTGPFRVRSWKPNESVELESMPSHFSGTPRLRRVVMPLIAEESSGLIALLGGQVDLTSTAPFADVPGLERRGSVQVLKQPGLNTRYIALNLRRPPFDDAHVRRALSMAFDRKALLKAVVFGEGAVTPGLLPPALRRDTADSLPELVTFNPERARAELARSRYGSGLQATILTWGSNWWRRIGEIFVGQVNQVLGTRLTVQAGDTNAVFARLRAGDFDAAVWGWLGLVDYDEYLGDILGRDGFRNFQGYGNPAFEALLEQGRRELDPEQRLAIYRRADLLMLEDMPVLPCFCSNVHHLANPRVRGFIQRPYSNYGDQFGAISLS